MTHRESQERELEFLRLREVERMTYEEIAARHGVSRQRAHQLVRRARRRLVSDSTGRVQQHHDRGVVPRRKTREKTTKRPDGARKNR